MIKKPPFVDRLNQTRNMPSPNETRNMLSISMRRQSRRESKSFRRTVRIAFRVEFSITGDQCCGSGYGILWFYDPCNRDPEKYISVIRNNHPGSYFRELCISVLCKIFFVADQDPGSGACRMKKSQIRDPG